MALNLRLFKHKTESKPSIRKKAVFSLGSIAVIFVLSGAITILEYRGMSDYVSDQISESISSITLSQQLSDITEEYHTKMLAAVIENDPTLQPQLDEVAQFEKQFESEIEALKISLTSDDGLQSLDKVQKSFYQFLDTSKAFDEVYRSAMDTGEWFFGTLQPSYTTLCHDIVNLNTAIHGQLHDDSVKFDDSFYRSIVPGFVCICAGLLLVMLLTYFILSNYVNPIYKIAAGLNAYKTSGKRYGNVMDGNDHLSDINADVTEIIEENIELKHRVKNLKEDR